MGKDRVPVLLNRAKGVNEEKGTNSSEADVLVLSIAGLAKKKERREEAEGELLIWIFPWSMT